MVKSRYAYRGVVSTFLMPNCFGQQKNYRIHTVAFYNFENLFDTINDPLMMMNGLQRSSALDIKNTTKIRKFI
jgi:hypothetical protein